MYLHVQRLINEIEADVEREALIFGSRAVG